MELAETKRFASVLLEEIARDVRLDAGATCADDFFVRRVWRDKSNTIDDPTTDRYQTIRVDVFVILILDASL